MRAFPESQTQKLRDKLDRIVQYHAELVEDLPSEEEFIRNRLPRRAIEIMKFHHSLNGG